MYSSSKLVTLSTTVHTNFTMSLSYDVMHQHQVLSEAARFERPCCFDSTFSTAFSESMSVKTLGHLSLTSTGYNLDKGRFIIVSFPLGNITFSVAPRMFLSIL